MKMTIHCPAWYYSSPQCNRPHEFKWNDLFINASDFPGICVFCGGRVTRKELEGYFSEAQDFIIAQKNKVLHNKIEKE